MLRSTVRQLPISRLSSKQRTNLLQRKSTAIWHALRTRLTFSLCSTQSLTSLLPTTLEDVASTEHKTLLIFPITTLALAPQETNFYFIRHLSLCSHLLLLIHFKTPKVVCFYKWDFCFPSSLFSFVMPFIKLKKKISNWSFKNICLFGVFSCWHNVSSNILITFLLNERCIYLFYILHILAMFFLLYPLKALECTTFIFREVLNVGRLRIDFKRDSTSTWNLEQNCDNFAIRRWFKVLVRDADAVFETATAVSSSLHVNSQIYRICCTVKLLPDIILNDLTSLPTTPKRSQDKLPFVTFTF